MPGRRPIPCRMHGETQWAPNGRQQMEAFLQVGRDAPGQCNLCVRLINSMRNCFCNDARTQIPIVNEAESVEAVQAVEATEAAVTDRAAVEQQMMQQAFEESLVSYRLAETALLGMDVQNTVTAVSDTSTSAIVCNSTMTSNPQGSNADKIPGPPSAEINNLLSCRHGDTSCQSSTTCASELSPQPTKRFCDTFRQSKVHVENCLCLSVELAPEGDKTLFEEVHNTMTIRDFKELLRHHWQLGQEEELMLLAQKRGGTDALEDQLTFNNVMADTDLVKPSKTMAKAGHHLTLSLRHCVPVTLAVNLRAEREQRQRERQAIMELERRRQEQEVIRDRPVRQRMCPRCGVGPVVNFECSNLASHNTVRGLFSNGTNACPGCNFFSSKWQDWAEWDEQRAMQLRNGYCGGLFSSGNF